MATVIESKQNKHIKECIRLLNSAKLRRELGLFLIEGARLCEDACNNGVSIDKIFYTEKASVKYNGIVKTIKDIAKYSFIVSENIIKNLTDTNSAQGIVCVCKMLDSTTTIDKISKSRSLGLENIQDPANLGAILRTAAALNFKNIVLTNDSCDIYSPKVLRASMGAIFKINLLKVDNMRDLIAKLNEENVSTYAAVVTKNALDIKNIKFNENCFVAIGNEGNGLRQATIESCKTEITIPMDKNTESLNASMAAGIVMWEMMR